MDETEGTTKLVLTADGRRWTQTFSSADLAAENRLALRATEKNYPTGFTGLCRISFSSGKR